MRWVQFDAECQWLMLHKWCMKRYSPDSELRYGLVNKNHTFVSRIKCYSGLLFIIRRDITCYFKISLEKVCTEIDNVDKIMVTFVTDRRLCYHVLGVKLSLPALVELLPNVTNLIYGWFMVKFGHSNLIRQKSSKTVLGLYPLYICLIFMQLYSPKTQGKVFP